MKTLRTWSPFLLTMREIPKAILLFFGSYSHDGALQSCNFPSAVLIEGVEEMVGFGVEACDIENAAQSTGA